MTDVFVGIWYIIYCYLVYSCMDESRLGDWRIHPILERFFSIFMIQWETFPTQYEHLHHINGTTLAPNS